MKDKSININEVITELKKDELNPDLIQDNKLHFEFDKSVYRVHLPNQRELSEATNYKNKEYLRMLNEEHNLTNKQLIKILKEKQSVDIDEIDEKAKKLEEEMMQYYLSLSKKKDSDKKSIKKLKEKLDIVRDKRLELILEKANFLAPSIENQMQDNYYRYLTSMCTEKLIQKQDKKHTEEIWEQVWDSFTEYQEDYSTLVYVALGRQTELMLGM